MYFFNRVHLYILKIVFRYFSLAFMLFFNEF
jgi:hypothetical protein